MASFTERPWYRYYRDNNVSEYSFNGSTAATKRLWDRYMKAMDNGDYRTAASVYNTFEQNNWHTENSAMVAEGDKPANQRKSFAEWAIDKSGYRDRDDQTYLKRVLRSEGKDPAAVQRRSGTGRMARAVGGGFTSAISRDQRNMDPDVVRRARSSAATLIARAKTNG